MSLYAGFEHENLPLVGGTMRGPLDMAYWGLKNLPACTDDGDAVSRQYLEGNYDVVWKTYCGNVICTLKHKQFSADDSLHTGVPLSNFLRGTESCRVTFYGISVDDDTPLNLDYRFDVRMTLYFIDNTKETYVVTAFTKNNSKIIDIRDSQQSKLVGIVPNNPFDWVITFGIDRTFVAFLFEIQETESMSGNEVNLSYKIKYKYSKVTR